VCLSLAWANDLDLGGVLYELRRPEMKEYVLDRSFWDHPQTLATGPAAMHVGRALLSAAAEDLVELVAHNAAFDVSVLVEAVASRDRRAGAVAMRDAFRAYDRGAIRCTRIRERLIEIARDGARGAKKGRFSLAGCLAVQFDEDRSAEKGAASLCPECQGEAALPHGGFCVRCDDFGMIGPWRLRYHQLDGVPLDQWPTEAIDYAIADSVDALRLCAAQDDGIVTPLGPAVIDGRVIDEVPQERNAFGLRLLECQGVLLDAEAVGPLDIEVTALDAEHRRIGVEVGVVRGPDGHAGAEPPGTKPGRPGSECRAAKEILMVAAYGDTPPRNKPTEAERMKAGQEGRDPIGSVKADRDGMLASGHEGLIAYAEGGAAAKLASTYLPILRAGVELGPVAGEGSPCGPLTCRCDSPKNSGRSSTSKPNWQNPPRDGGFRGCVVPRPGHLFVSCDYAAIELRALAQICEWEGFGSTLANSFRAGRDPHLEFAAWMMHMDYDKAVQLKRAADPIVLKRRQFAKIANYGFGGGLGAERFVAHARREKCPLDPDPEHALEISWELRNAWRGKWAEMESYFAMASRLAYDEETGSTGHVRQYVSGRIRGGCFYTVACNTFFQGLVADGALAALYDVTRACRGFGPHSGASPQGALLGCRPVLFLHDEVIIEAPVVKPDGQVDLDHLTAAADELSQVMVAAMVPYIPDIPVVAEPAAMRRWHKGAEEIRDERGRLLIWEPPAAVAAGATKEVA
jgi:hypothetical protein